MLVTLTQRDDGSIASCLKIYCFENKGELVTRVYDKDGNIVFENITRR